MTELTVRLRSSLGQNNVKTTADTLLSEFLTKNAALYGFAPGKFATKLFTDQSCTQRLIKANFATDTKVTLIVKQNAQIIYVKLQDEQTEEAVDESIEQKIQKMTKEEIYQVMLRPEELSPDCAHNPQLNCLKCLKHWEKKILKVAGIAELDWQQFCNRRNVEMDKEIRADNVSGIKDIKLQTMNQLKLSFQEEIPIKRVILSEQAMKKIQDQIAKTYFNHFFTVQLFGNTANGVANIDYVHIMYYQTIFGTQIQPNQPLYTQINETVKEVLLKNFKLNYIGIGFVSQHGQFTKHQIIQALNEQQRLVLHFKLYNSEQGYKKVENEQIQERFKILNSQKMQLTLQSSTRDMICVEPYYLNDQICFLFKNKVIDQQTNKNLFELQFNQKQIINEQFLAEVDTACFLTYLAISIKKFSVEGSSINYKFNCYNLINFIEGLNMGLDLSANQQLIKNDPNTRTNILNYITTFTASIIADPTFQILLVLSGFDIIGKDLNTILGMMKALVEK
ncbi:Conserved_hypothetical protein [Hexamita inflata]|uniref:Uncharacterized protein n=1 Tax=Hexamita inflata TaxID=28002 RepID=A0ABP1KPZ3_9EUKA